MHITVARKYMRLLVNDSDGETYAHSKYTGTQTQKTDSELFYHNDRTAHDIQADCLALLGMRSHEENRVCSQGKGISLLFSKKY